MGAPRGAARRSVDSAPGAPETTDQGDRTPNSSGPGRRNTKSASGVGKRAEFRYLCPSCGEKENTVRQGQYGPLCKCFKCSFDELADAAGVTVPELIEDPWSVLAPFATGGPNGAFSSAAGGYVGARPRRVDALPSEWKVASWAIELLRDRGLRRLLLRERGLRRATLAHFLLGWDEVRGGFTLPIYDESGDLVNVSWRAPKGRSLALPSGKRLSKYRLAGRTAEGGGLPLYPMPLPKGPLLLGEGEWDALVARQAGLPAVTGLLGKQWNSAWDRFVVGRRVAVAYDVGAEDDARRTVERLREAGARRAWVVPLGLPEKGDDLTDWWVTYGRTADELLDLIRRARRPR